MENDISKLLALLELKSRVQAKEHQSLLQVFYALLAATGCVARLERQGDQEALANLGAMSRLIANRDSYGNSRSFYAFQCYLKLLREGGVDPVLIPVEDAVQVMTIHQAKGLEFPVVALGAAMEGRLPSRERKSHYEVPYDLRASGKPEADDPHLVDARKLFYVAATRARDLLIIGTSDVVNIRGGGPSRFLTEMFGDDLRQAADLTGSHIEAVLTTRDAPREARKRFSYGELAHYTQCPMRFKFTSIYGFEAQWLDLVGFGANVHRALETIHQEAMAGRTPDRGAVEEILANISGGDYRPNRSYCQHCDEFRSLCPYSTT